MNANGPDAPIQRLRRILIVSGLAFGGLVAGFAWARSSVFCEPGLLQGNPICPLLMLIAGGGLGFAGLGLGALVVWVLDGRPPVPGRDPDAPTYGPGVRTGAAIGTAATLVLYLGSGSWREAEATPGLSILAALLVCVPLAIGVALGAWFDRRE